MCQIGGYQLKHCGIGSKLTYIFIAARVRFHSNGFLFCIGGAADMAAT